MNKKSSSHTTMLPVTAFFVRKAEAALAKAANRVADLHFFEQVLARLKSGEDLSPELAAFKKVDKKAAIESTKTLIKRCKDDLTKGYWDIKSKKITLKVKVEFIANELVPRYTAIYKVEIKSGEVVIRVETAGATVEVHTNTKKCKATTEDQVQDQVMKELVMAGLKG
jgi:hypothetical protein